MGLLFCVRPLRVGCAQKGAETVSKSNIKVLPFISQYKWVAIVVIVFLFAIEIVLSTVRALYPNSVAPSYASPVVAFIVQLTLIVCYLSAAVAIIRRIGSRGKTIVRRMTIRIAVSCLGYIICLAAIVAFSLSYQAVWGRGMTLNAIFLGLNLAGLMQVLALKPSPQHSKSSKSSSHKQGSSKTVSMGHDSARGPGSHEPFASVASNE